MDLAAEIYDALKKQVSLQMLREIVCRYKHSGGTQQEAYVTLEKIRDEWVEESQEDLILKLMDFVSGFCSKDQRIWDDMLIHS
jgi:hypothetical protein